MFGIEFFFERVGIFLLFTEDRRIWLIFLMFILDGFFFIGVYVDLSIKSMLCRKEVKYSWS